MRIYAYMMSSLPDGKGHFFDEPITKIKFMTHVVLILDLQRSGCGTHGGQSVGKAHPGTNFTGADRDGSVASFARRLDVLISALNSWNLDSSSGSRSI